MLERGITQARRRIAERNARHDRLETWAVVILTWAVVALVILAVAMLP